METQENYVKLSKEELMKLELPSIPEHLSKMIKINWLTPYKAKDKSVLSAKTDPEGYPLVELKLLYEGKVTISENIKYKYIHKEVEVFVSVAEDISNCNDIGELVIR